MKIVRFVLVSVAFTCSMPLIAFPWPIPDTGQTKCYDDQGNELNPCPSKGEDFYGQDGNYTINPPSYQKLGYGGQELHESATDWIMVRDNVTGLIWEVKTDDGSVHDKDNTYTWYDSNSATNGGNPGTAGDGTDTEDFIQELNLQSFGGFSDWRLPTAKELLSIMHLSVINPAIDIEPFPNAVSGSYWSTTTVAAAIDRAWFVSFSYGGLDRHYKSTPLYVRAVRGFSPQSSDTLIINGDRTVTDMQTGLMWHQTTMVNVTWANAVDDSAFSIRSGYTDWRLPTAKELLSIADLDRDNPAINDTVFDENSSEWYWSASTNVHDPGGAWLVSFDHGYLGYSSKSIFLYARPLRGGQNRIPDHLIIEKPSQASLWNIDADMPITWNPAGISGNVAISLSRQGGRSGTFEPISSSTPNDGNFQWTVSGAGTVNAALKIVPLSDPTKATVQSLFTIVNNVSISPLARTISEPAEEKTFTVSLTQATTSDVEIDLATTNPGEFSLVDGGGARTDALTVTLNGTNWDTGVLVTIRAEADSTPDGDQKSMVLRSKVRSADPDFGGLHVANVSVTVLDDATGVSISSVAPTYGTVGALLDITVKGDGFIDGTTAVSIIHTGGSEISVSPVRVDDPNTLHVTIPDPGAAVDYDLKVSNSTLVADVLPSAISFATIATVSAQRAKKAVIVAGGGPFLDNDLWISAWKNAVRAYQSLLGQGYDPDSIQLLASGAFDLTGNGTNDVDDDATLTTLQNAITDWSTNASPAAIDLLIYLIGPGEPGKFYLKQTEDYEMALTTATLDGWLNTVKASLSGDLILIVDAPASGGFLTGMTQSRPLVITGSTGNERSWYLDDGEVSFSWPFWEAIFDGGELFAAFDHADDIIGTVQTPAIDATGDGTPDPRSRARSTDTLTIGRARSVETDPPIIGAVFPDTVINTGTGAELWAEDITADNGLSQVWARIYPPVEAVQAIDQPILVLPTVKLTDTDGDDRYSNAYGEFIYQGDYKIVIHASDKREYHALPKMALVTQNVGMAYDLGDLDMDGALTLADAIIALRAAVDLPIPRTLHLEPTGDDRIGVGDALLILQWVSGARP